MSRPPHAYGDPLQVWKWPALLLIGIWAYLGDLGSGTAAGFALGSLVGTALVFILATLVARRAGIAQRMPWWLQGGVATVAGVLAFFGAAGATTTPLAAFTLAYLVLLSLAWLVWAGAGIVGLRERPVEEEGDTKPAE